MQCARLMTGVTSHMSTAELLLHTEDRRQIGQDDYQMRATTKLSKQRVLEKLAKLKNAMKLEETNKASSSELCRLVEDAVNDGEQH